MGELSDAWSSYGQKNIFGTVPQVIEMQSEAGAAGAVHGALQAGALTTTFTASQGLLLMIPNMFKIAGELTSTVFHIAARSIAVLDRTKEPGAIGEPLYQDVLTAIFEEWASRAPENPLPRVIGGRYGLSSKEFTPAMVMAVLNEIKQNKPERHFTIGIHDDVTQLSLKWDPQDWKEPQDVHRAVFYGLGSDGTVGANKNSVKILGEDAAMFAQGYFVYDSKKVGSVTVSHLRFSRRPINSSYLIDQASFVACHQFHFLESRDVLTIAQDGATFLLNAPHGPDLIREKLPLEVQRQIIEKRLRTFVIDADKVADDAGLGGRINTIMQTCFFAIADVLPRDEAIDQIKLSIRKSYAKRGGTVLQRNFAAVDSTLKNRHQVMIPAGATATIMRRPVVRTPPFDPESLLQPLFEFSGACAGCGETPYLKLMSQLFGDRAVIANATGCSSIFGGNLPTTPWTVNAEGRGPAWSNSLFEDNAEFGLGMRLALDQQLDYAQILLKRLESDVSQNRAILSARSRTLPRGCSIPERTAW